MESRATKPTPSAPVTARSIAWSRLKEAKEGIKVTFAWWIVDAEARKNQKIKEIDYTTESNVNIVHGHLSLPQDWPRENTKLRFTSTAISTRQSFTVD